MKNNLFSEIEFPFYALSRFGLTEEMLLDLPQSALKKIGEGGHSPVLPIRYQCENGVVIESKARIRLVREQDGAVAVMFSPKLCRLDLSSFGDTQKKILEDGKPVFGTVTTDDGTIVESIYQLDKELNQVMTVHKPILINNLRIIKEKYGLNLAESTCLINGNPLTIYIDDQPKTIGIDLNDENGIRIEDGEEEEWRLAGKREWNKYEFGINGCWVTDEEGNLDYVHEEDYTDELWNEQKKAAMRRMPAPSAHR